jgi:TRAP transporter TAXI family solute receptor
VRAIAVAAFLLATMLTAGCSRGPDAPALRAEVQGKLDQRFKPGLFELVALRRQGSAPLPASDSGNSRLAVYFNATLKLTREYDFSNWEGLSSGTLAQILGATEKGIIGVKAGETRPGELIRVYGSSTYRWADGRWQGVDATTPGVVKTNAAPGDAAPPSRSKQLIDRLAALVEIPPPGVNPQDEQIVSEELERAVQAITARRDRRQHINVIASGPDGGEYQPIVRAVIARASRLDSKIKMQSLATPGSVENARLIGSRHADYALVQSNVAAMAATGDGPFSRGGAVPAIRALGSLFPEPVHIVVSAASRIRTIADLRGKRVAIGARDSGTRADALAILATHGLTEKDLAAVLDDGLEAASARLRAGEIDAFFATVGAPARELQRLATLHPIRLVSLNPGAADALITRLPGLVHLLVPANTYPDQKDDVTTIAAAALLVTHADVTDAEAAVILGLVFESPDYLAAGSAQGAKISKRTGLRGITIPLHPAATRYFGPAAPTPAPPAAPKS